MATSSDITALAKLRADFGGTASTLMGLEHVDKSASLEQITEVNDLINKAERRPTNKNLFNAAAKAVKYLHDLTEAQALLGTDTALTGLPNRVAFNSQLKTAIKETGSQAKFVSRPNSETASTDTSEKKNYFALLFLDLDRFKGINDDFGHDTGDEFLCAFADHLRRITRKDEGNFFKGRSRASRLGGDEFAVLLDTQASSPEEAEKIFKLALERIRKSMEAVSFDYKGRSFPIVSSIGMHVIKEGDTPEVIMKGADTGLYEAKKDKSQRYDHAYETLKKNGAQNLQYVEDKRPQSVELTLEQLQEIMQELQSSKVIIIADKKGLADATTILAQSLKKKGANIKGLNAQAEAGPDSAPGRDAL
ncbi:MAG: GGDEF domain-containing protein [Alphaproteobacteria bacterium]|nr:GGDEF domain-containing protein [Alphaproteobacteria bacterium]